MSKFKHLTDIQRSLIEASLSSGESFKSIAYLVSKDPSTISKEILKHRQIQVPKEFGEPKNMCSKRKECKKGIYCTYKQQCNKSCFNCKSCNNVCNNYHYQECSLLSKPPYICNPCSKKTTCREIKYIYSAYNSQKEYKNLLSSARRGINISQEQFIVMDNLIYDLIINQRLSISHIVHSNKDIITLSERTIYRYFENKWLSAKDLDLPRKLSFKVRETNKDTAEIEYFYLKNRRHLDFLEYIKNNPEQEVIEMDCVEGPKGTSVLLTMLFRKSSLMLIFKLEKKTADCVNNTLKKLMKTVGKTRFKKFFAIFLVDRGSEFKRLHEIEVDDNNNQITRVFYCDPGRPDQKGMLEKNHTIIRMVYPKGYCFDSLTDDDVNSLMNNINNYLRKIYDWKTPLEIFLSQKPIKFINTLGQKKIASNKVCLKAKSPKK